MKLGDIHNQPAAVFGKPLSGVRILSFEQYIAVPFATQMLVRLGAEVVKVEQVGIGDPARLGAPYAIDRSDRRAGASLLRYNLGKQSLSIDLKSEEGSQLLRSLASGFDVVCENLGPGRAEKMGLGYARLAQENPGLVYLSITGFGQRGQSPYKHLPAMAGVAEAMCGALSYGTMPGERPTTGRYGPLGDTATALFGVIGVLAALMHREKTGLGQHVDVAMLDSMVAVCDHIPNFWSLGAVKKADEEPRSPGIITACPASDGWFVLHALRRHQFERLAQTIGQPGWIDDPRLAGIEDWTARLEDTIKPAIVRWAAPFGKAEAARRLAEAGIPSAPCITQEELVPGLSRSTSKNLGAPP